MLINQMKFILLNCMCVYTCMCIVPKLVERFFTFLDATEDVAATL